MLIQLRKMVRPSLFMLIATLFFFSCQKDIKDSNSPDVPGNENPDLSSKVTSSVSGFVTDENNAPVEGATVNVGIKSTTTDNIGYFEIKDVEVVKNAAVVTVSQTGYFKGIKTYMASAGKSAFFRIKLLPKTIAGTINGNTGGNVSLANGLEVSFPASAVVYASDGAAYSGTVNIAAQWIDPTASDLNEKMPGDLRGLNEDGALRMLTTYGMTAIELTGTGGELLQVAPGKKATLTVPLPSSLSGAAPASIPLWYFNESNGLWQQEGSALKTGNSYVGDVSHFSFWNCDVPSTYVQLDFTLVDADNTPVPFVFVKLFVTGTTNIAYGYTDENGYVSGAVPSNASLTMEIYSRYICGTPVYTQTFSTGSTNLSLGNVTLPPSNQYTGHVTVRITDCTNIPITDGAVIMMIDNIFYRFKNLTLNGVTSETIDFYVALCNTTGTNVTFIGEDYNTNQQSTPLPYSLLPGENNLGDLQACGITAEQYINYTTDGTPHSYTSPADSFYMDLNTASPAMIFITGSHNIGSGMFESINFAFTQSGIAAGSTQELTSFYINSSMHTFVTPFNVNITEYGSVGEFIAGNFNGTFTDANGNPIVISVSFRTRRTM